MKSHVSLSRKLYCWMLYNEASKLVHPLTSGSYFQPILSHWLKSLLPSKFWQMKRKMQYCNLHVHIWGITEKLKICFPHHLPFKVACKPPKKKKKKFQTAWYGIVMINVLRASHCNKSIKNELSKCFPQQDKPRSTL